MVNYRKPQTAAISDQQAYDEGLRQQMLRVYNYMTAGLGISGLIAFLTSTSPALMNAIFGTPLQWVVMLAPLGFVFFLSFKIQDISASKAQTIFWAFCAVMGVSISWIFMIYTGGSIVKVFFISSGMFAATSLYGYTTKKDLASMGSFMMMGLFGIIIASIVNLFMKSSGLDFAISLLGVVIFIGLTAWDTQRIKEMYNESYGSEANEKVAIMGALTLYLNFLNMFLFLLRLLGDRK